MINTLLSRSAELEGRLVEFLRLPPFDQSERITTSKVMCSIAFEHAESAKILIASSNLTSATGLVRLQFEALVRAMWLLYAATDHEVLKLSCELTVESAQEANKTIMLTDMLKALEGRSPQEPLDMLIEFKDYCWKPLYSFVHGGLHPIHRHSEGYPVQQLCQMLRISNGVSVMAGMLLVILHGGGQQMGKIPKIQQDFADCLPDFRDF